MLIHDGANLEAGPPILADAIAVARAAGDRSAEAIARRHLATFTAGADGERHLVAAVECARAAGNVREEGYALGLLGDRLLVRGQLDESQPLIDEARRLLRETGDDDAYSAVLRSAGYLALRRNDLAGARATFSEMLAASHGIARSSEMSALLGLGRVALADGDLAGARDWMTRSAELAREHGFVLQQQNVLVGLARLRQLEGDTRRAARLFGVRVTPGEEGRFHNPHLGRSAQQAVQEYLVAARAVLGDEELAAALAEGRALSLDEALDEALAPPAGRAAAWADAAPSSLTRREREIAALVAAGQSDRQIAEALVVAHATVERHIASITRKLRVHSRAEIVAWHVRQDRTGAATS